MHYITNIKNMSTFIEPAGQPRGIRLQILVLTFKWIWVIPHYPHPAGYVVFFSIKSFYSVTIQSLFLLNLEPPRAWWLAVLVVINTHLNSYSIHAQSY